MKPVFKALIFASAIGALLFAVAVPNTYAASGPDGSSLTCRPNDARCVNNSDCCSKTCIWCGQKNCCR